MNQHPVLSDQALQVVAERFRLLGEPMRLKLLQALQDGEKTVTELVVLTGGGQANVSKHLSVLATAGVVGRRKEGLNVFYRIEDPSVYALCDTVCGALAVQLQARQAVIRPALR